MKKLLIYFYLTILSFIIVFGDTVFGSNKYTNEKNYINRYGNYQIFRFNNTSDTCELFIKKIVLKSNNFDYQFRISKKGMTVFTIFFTPTNDTTFFQDTLILYLSDNVYPKCKILLSGRKSTKEFYIKIPDDFLD